MTTRTERLIEYAVFSQDFDFPDEIEIALENDYADNQYLYDEEVLKAIKLSLLLCHDLSPQEVLERVRTWYVDRNDTQTEDQK